MMDPLFLLPLAAAMLSFVLLGRLARCLGRPGGMPPGTLGLPLLGETLRLISAYKTEFPDPFVDERLRRLRGGQRVFTTHLFGEPTVFSADPEVNRQVLQGEGRVFVSSYPSSITTLLGRRSLLVMRGAFHRRMHGLLGSTIASPVVIRDHLLPDIDCIIRRTLDSWEDADCPAGNRVLLQDQAKKITFDLTVKQLMSVDPGDWTEGLRKEYLLLIGGFFSLPVPFSFTTYGRALKARTQVAEGLRSVVRERKQEALLNRAEDVAAGGDDQLLEKGGGVGKRKRNKDLLGALLEAEREDGEEFTEEEAVDFLLALLVAGYETTSTIMTLAVKYLADHPRALAHLREEHEAIRERKEQTGGGVLDWADYKSMPFTQCVINETLRVANIISGVFRRAVADVPIKGGYTIPKGCKVFASFRAVHMDPAYYADARSFDPWRWWSPPPSPQQKTSGLDQVNGGGGGGSSIGTTSAANNNKDVNSKQPPPPPQQQQQQVGGGPNLFCPFGGGPRLCPGYELARVEISVFLHYLVTRFSWEAAEDDKVVFFPTTRAVKGYPINVRPRRRPSLALTEGQ
ncbi:hypothetical protein Taro_010195 [Colocasia esculenta]|uniref:Cytochrome P450 90A1 n=1 Tax=Colocasia esculenta TaxID=4460 RepID=A0A843TY98_COLES|nr:hypothetical protein [Colocasia esculenta]